MNSFKIIFNSPTIKLNKTINSTKIVLKIQKRLVHATVKSLNVSKCTANAMLEVSFIFNFRK